MAWVRLSDDFYDHPKFDKAGALGIALFTAGLAWSNRNLTNGFIPRKKALGLLDFEDVVEAVEAARNADRNAVTNGGSNGLDNDALTLAIARGTINKLLNAGLWHEEDDGYRIHDYLDYQPSRGQVEAGRENNAARQKAWRERRKAEKQAENHSERNADRNAVTNGPVTPAPNPNPKREVLRTSHISVSADHEETPTQTTPSLLGDDTPTPAPADSKRTRPKDDPHFAEFWRHYPKKTDKPGARRAFKRALDEGANPHTIIAGAKLYAQMWDGADREELHWAVKSSKWLAEGMWDGSWPMRNVVALRPAAGSHVPFRNPTDPNAYTEEW